MRPIDRFYENPIKACSFIWQEDITGQINWRKIPMNKENMSFETFVSVKQVSIHKPGILYFSEL